VSSSASVVVTVDSYGAGLETGQSIHERIFASLEAQAP